MQLSGRALAYHVEGLGLIPISAKNNRSKTKFLHELWVLFTPVSSVPSRVPSTIQTLSYYLIGGRMGG